MKTLYECNSCEDVLEDEDIVCVVHEGEHKEFFCKECMDDKKIEDDAEEIDEEIDNTLEETDPERFY